MKKTPLKILLYTGLALLMLTLVIVGYGCYKIKANFEAGALESRELVLAEDLAVMRKGIKQYYRDKSAPPQTLTDLVKAGYIPFIPPDPNTNAQDWQIIYGEYESPDKKKLKGIVDVKSSSPLKSSNGKPYNQW